jgi:hypothetical protein
MVGGQTTSLPIVIPESPERIESGFSEKFGRVVKWLARG